MTPIFSPDYARRQLSCLMFLIAVPCWMEEV